MKEEKVFALQTDKFWDLIAYKEKGLIKSESKVLDIIVNSGDFDARSKLEEDPSYKQIIPYAIISNKNSFYLFKRTTKQTEKRLHNKFSLGVGGHMNPNGTVKENYLIDELKRELFEEVILGDDCNIIDIEFVGFINDDTNSVGSVHIGLLYNIKVSSNNILINEKDKMTGEWVSQEELNEYYEPMETWSKITYDYYIK